MCQMSVGSALETNLGVAWYRSTAIACSVVISPRVAMTRTMGEARRSGRMSSVCVRTPIAIEKRTATTAAAANGHP
jgi:hypothetical protein